MATLPPHASRNDDISDWLFNNREDTIGIPGSATKHLHDKMVRQALVKLQFLYRVTVDECASDRIVEVS